MRFAQAISVRGKVVSSAQHHLHRLSMSHHTRDYGQTSSCSYKGWAPSKSTHSGWSKRATRGYQTNYDRDDRRHEWDGHVSRGSNQARWAAAADIEIVDERDSNPRIAHANNAAGSGPDTATLVFVGDAATEKDAIPRRLGEHHRRVNNRNKSLNGSCRKNTDANEKAYDLNQKSIQALDALAKEYVDFEATMANVARGRRCDTQNVRRDSWRARTDPKGSRPTAG